MYSMVWRDGVAWRGVAWRGVVRCGAAAWHRVLVALYGMASLPTSVGERVVLLTKSV